MALIVKVIQAISEGLSKIINSCKCSCKSCCGESECHERNVTPPVSPDGVRTPKVDIKEFSTRIV